MKSGIYQIINLINGMIYVGSAVNLIDRWHTHQWALNKNRHPNKYLQAAWNKYGAENFICKVLQMVDKSKLREAEQIWIDSTKCCNREIGYNLNPNAESSRGSKWTEERKKIQSERMMGFRHTEESKAWMREIRKHTSPETIEKYKATRKASGYKITQETKDKISKANAGKTRNRRYDKYPHELASKCRCKDCLKIRSEELKNWRHSKKPVEFIMVNKNV